MSFLPSHGFIGHVLNIFKQCQSKSYVDQYFIYGIRYFDLRISFCGQSYNHIIFKNGYVTYETFSFHNVMQFFNERKNCHVRLSLDTTGQDDKEQLTKQFNYLCSNIEELYQDVDMFGGTDTTTNHCIYLFKKEHENTSVILEDIFDHGQKKTQQFISTLQKFTRSISPRLHAFLFNRWIRKAFLKSERLVIMDFINI